MRHTHPHSFIKRGTNKASVSKKSPSYQVYILTALPTELLAGIIQHFPCDLTYVRVCIFLSPLSESGKMHGCVSLPSKL